MKKKSAKRPPQKSSAQYATIWKLVDGAIADAFNAHPEYLNKEVSEARVRTSICKRVTGIVTSYAETHGAPARG